MAKKKTTKKGKKKAKKVKKIPFDIDKALEESKALQEERLKQKIWIKKVGERPPSKAQKALHKQKYPEQYKQIEKAKTYAKAARIKLGLEKKENSKSKNKKKLVMPSIKETEMEQMVKTKMYVPLIEFNKPRNESPPKKTVNAKTTKKHIMKLSNIYNPIEISKSKQKVKKVPMSLSPMKKATKSLSPIKKKKP